jgi:trk system potassium uptake protein TrkA
MKIIIVGGGVVGSSLAEHLLRDKHQLSMIEQDGHLCKSLGDKLDMQVLHGSGSSPYLLREAGIESADIVLAVTPVDEINMIVCAIARQYNVASRIARIRSRELTRENARIDLDGIGITSVIHPENTMVDQIMQYIETPHAVYSANFEEGQVLLRGYRVRDNMDLCSKTPREIRQLIAPEVVLFAAIVRRGVGMIPDGNTRIEPGDIVYALLPREVLSTFLKLVGIEVKKNRKLIVTGDSYATIETVQALDKTDYKVTFVDPNLEQANEIAGRFDSVEVLHGDCTDIDLLREINVDAASFFVAVSDTSEYNMFSALLAKAEGAHEVMATAYESHHDKLYQSIGIDHVINPRVITARAILEHIYRGHLAAAVPLSDVDIDAVRFIVAPDSSIAGVKIKSIARKLKKGSIIGMIVREDKLILPDGETVVESDDHVIVIADHKNIPALEKLFKSRDLSNKG